MPSLMVFVLGLTLYSLSFVFKQYFFQLGLLGSLLIASTIYIWVYVDTVEPVIGNMRKCISDFKYLMDEHSKKMEEYCHEIKD